MEENRHERFECEAPQPRSWRFNVTACAKREEQRVVNNSTVNLEGMLAASRNANTQPTYDFLGGGGGASPPQAKTLQQSFRQSQAIPGKPDLDNENLRAQIKSLQYEVNSLKSERDFEKLRHEQELQDVQARADTDFNKAQVG
ncbi:MAG: hypothetical protein LQ352_006356 [Teloschistes flavicans]|nr:MAG: hypothetical protein LQ352_006356 [Teloschistes flavicans]